MVVEMNRRREPIPMEFVSLRMPARLVDKLDRFAEQSGATRSEAVRQLVDRVTVVEKQTP